jgi:hypothetical protein
MKPLSLGLLISPAIRCGALFETSEIREKALSNPVGPQDGYKEGVSKHLTRRVDGNSHCQLCILSNLWNSPDCQDSRSSSGICFIKVIQAEAFIVEPEQ